MIGRTAHIADERLTLPRLVRLIAESFLLLLTVTAWLALRGTSPEPGVIAYAVDVSAGTDPSARARMTQLPRPATVAEFTWTIAADLSGHGPLALQAAGPFSADFYWNGVLVGRKGEPGESRAQERAGPIDFLAAIPDSLVADTGNTVRVVYSSHHAGYEPASIVQVLSILPYRPDQRRSLRYYGLLVILSGALIGLAGMLVYLARERGAPASYWLALAVAGLLLAGGAEVSRSLVNYPYDWHQPRQAAQFIGFAAFWAAVIRHLQARWTTGVPGAAIWLAAAVFAVTAFLAPTGYDARTAMLSGLLSALAFLLAGWTAFRNDRQAALWLPILLVSIAAAVRLPILYLDSLAYLLAAAFLGHLLLRRASLLVPHSPPVSAPVSLAVPVTGRTIYLPLAAIVSLKAAGNYTEIRSDTGTVTLDGRNIAQVLDLLPDRFMRVHRSWAVDLDRVAALRTRAGSRYHLELHDGGEIPVGRARVDAVRQRLG
ncbi:MAG: hypothetical protein GC208_00245 [Alphaproteobacteria bacterium]|nr:hypothetical protein [Alphaproteobacteria bacterium]